MPGLRLAFADESNKGNGTMTTLRTTAAPAGSGATPIIRPRTPAGPARRRRRPTLVAAGLLVAGPLALLGAAGPARADGDGLEVGNGRLASHGTDVHVPVTYRCDLGQTAGVGIFLTQGGRGRSSVFGGAGSGQRPCTGDSETVDLTIHTGTGHFRQGRASVSISLFITGSASADKQFTHTESIRLNPCE
jgi:hypothetical protein